MAESAKELTLDHLYVDNASMQIILRPEQFDVMLTSNLFGDILSDEASALVGSIGMVPSWSSGDGPPLVEPIHGSAPQLVGKDLANPSGTIFASRCCCASALALPKRLTSSSARSMRCWPRAYAPRTSRSPARRLSAARNSPSACARKFPSSPLKRRSTLLSPLNNWKAK